MLKFGGVLIGLIIMSFLVKDWLLIVLIMLMVCCFWMVGMMYFVGGDYCYIFMGLGIDIWSTCLILLSFWMVVLMVLSSVKVFFKSEFIVILSFMMFFLFLSFSFLGYLGFYISFEASLVPTLFMIMGWGYQPERVQAGMYLIFYTLGFSLPLFMVVMKMWWMLGNMMMGEVDECYSFFVYLGLVGAFLVKMPMFFFHLWLPKAHVEAPVAGSMILAGILLKLGGYGLMRVMLIIKSYLGVSVLWISLSLLGGFVTSMVCLCQVDMKSLVAYSSVGHMGMVISGLFSGNFFGYQGAYVMMLAHGLCSSGMFCAVNMMYERVLSRSLIVSKGMLELFPFFALWWFLLCVSNMAAPPSLNLVGEIMLICGLISMTYYNIVIISLLSFFSAVYSLHLYALSQHGKMLMKFSVGLFLMREYVLLIFHWLPLNLLFMKLGLSCGII